MQLLTFHPPLARKSLTIRRIGKYIHASQTNR
jgi:hypothetical protein